MNSVIYKTVNSSLDCGFA